MPHSFTGCGRAVLSPGMNDQGFTSAPGSLESFRRRTDTFQGADQPLRAIRSGNGRKRSGISVIMCPFSSTTASAPVRDFRPAPPHTPGRPWTIFPPEAIDDVLPARAHSRKEMLNWLDAAPQPLPETDSATNPLTPDFSAPGFSRRKWTCTASVGPGRQLFQT